MREYNGISKCFNRCFINHIMKFFVTLGILGVLASSADAGASMHNPFFCYTTDPIRSMTNMGAHITSYESIRRFNFTTVNPYISTCTPSRFWYLGRYAARLPLAQSLLEMVDFAESSIQDDIVRNYEAGRTTLCRQDFENIRDFSMDTDFERQFTIENVGLVTESGLIAMRNIARRFQEAFPTILTQNYSPDRFFFRHTITERTNASIRAFASGLFGETNSQNVIYEDVPDVDWLLRPTEFCPAFDQEIANFSALRTAFENGPEFIEMIEQINRKLGFHTSNQLNVDDIYTMWGWCRFKIASTFETSGSVTGPDSPWCAGLSMAHHLILNYRSDMGFFYRYGYGVRNQRLLQNLVCGLMQDLLTHMQSENSTDQMARIHVTHFEEILSMLVTLGTFRDVWPLHEHNFAQQTARHWVLSLISPFSTNLAVVRFDCDDGDHDLIFLLNEKPILVPGCDQQTGVCKLSIIVNRFRRFIDANCAVSFCSND